MKAGVFNVLTTVIIVGLAIWAAVSLYSRYIENPWTRDGQVRANIVGIAPRVSGPIIQVRVRDNQPERKGDLLFEIDPSDFQAQVDTSSYWVADYFKETQLPHIKVGQKALITVMGYENKPFQRVVRSVGWGIYVEDGSGSSSTALLPSISPTIDWVRLPQCFPVRIQILGSSPVPLRIGQTVSVTMTASFSPASSNDSK